MVEIVQDGRLLLLRWDDIPAPEIERRRFQRWPLAARVKLAARESELSARCLDVSLGGALLEIDAQRLDAALPGQVLLYLTLPTEAAPLALVARLVERRRRRVRVSFDPLPAEAARALVRAIVATPVSPAASQPLPN